MDTKEILNQIDAEISRLQQVLSLLAGAVPATAAKRKRGRPFASTAPAAVKGKRTLSADARARIAAAQKLRWAKSRLAVKKAARATPNKSVPSKAAKSSPPKKVATVARKQAPAKATDAAAT